MKCKILMGTFEEAVEQFNEWAKDKSLTRDVIIHELTFQDATDPSYTGLAIIVYYLEGSPFDTGE